MNEDVQEKAIAEAYRVLKEKGELSIWDVEIDSAYPEPFLADLDIQFEDKDIHATLGIVKHDDLSAHSIKERIE